MGFYSEGDAVVANSEGDGMGFLAAFFVQVVDVVIAVVVEDVVEFVADFGTDFDLFQAGPGGAFAFEDQFFDFFGVELAEQLLRVDEAEAGDDVDVAFIFLGHGRVDTGCYRC